MSTKTNERPGTKAQVRYLRMSASKARVVLDLIRGKHVAEADQILAYSERLAAAEIRKILRSAVANAQHNDELAVDELFVSACFADEGPTLKRFRPRARGRAGRIHKQTCHVTVIVSRLDDETLDRLRAKAESSGNQGDAAAQRRARVAKSQAAEDADEAEVSEAQSTAVDSDADGEVNATDESPYGEGSHALIDGDPDQMPEGFEIKGNADSKLYHTPESPFYGRTKAEVWFATEEAAEAAGFAKPASQQDDDEAGDAAEETATDEPEGDA